MRLEPLYRVEFYAFHSTGNKRYAPLNTGEARDRTIRLEIAEFVFEPLARSDPL
ncbi:MAG TPA: hypothetical protein VK496_05880 [Gaiellaceae bacterium]|nr:hypothetical protein [Gaiellaceae bacterium]